MKTDPNDSSGPTNSLVFPNNGEVMYGQNGLTKREYFAAIALQGILAGTSGVESLASIGPSGWASVAVSQAEALIEELNK